MIKLYTDEDVPFLIDQYRPHTADGAPQALPRRTKYGSPEADQIGLIPVGDYPDMIPQPADYQAIIEDCIAKQQFPIHHYYRAFGNSYVWNQDGWGYCWAYSLAMSVMLSRAAEGMQHVVLSPFSLSWLVNDRNAGYYLDSAINGARQRGLATMEYCPEFTMNKKSGWQQNALLHRPTEWWDCSPSNMTGHCIAVLRTGRPLYMAYNWWNHALCIVGMRWSNGVVWQIRNSHGESDVIEGQGSKWTPDEAYGVRATSFVG